jgi:hypothetical protein
MNEQYVEHEVRIRVMEELSKRMDNKLNIIIGLFVSSLIVPVLLHSIGLV